MSLPNCHSSSFHVRLSPLYVGVGARVPYINNSQSVPCASNATTCENLLELKILGDDCRPLNLIVWGRAQQVVFWQAVQGMVMSAKV